MTDRFEKEMNEIDELFQKQDYKNAYFRLKHLVDYPNTFENDQQMLLTIRMAAMLGNKFGNHTLLEMGNKIMQEPTPQGIYDFAKAMFDDNWYGLAAAIFDRFLQIHKDSKLFLNELVSSLIPLELHEDAVTRLKQNMDLVKTDINLAYYLAFCAVYAGDMQTAREAFKIMESLQDKTIEFHGILFNRIQEYIERYTTVSPTADLKNIDLRAWYYVINNSVLTYLSPYGMKEMNGRFGAGRDSVAQIKFGAERIKAAATALAIHVKQVLYIDDFKSEVLARVLAQVLDVPVKKLTADNQTDEGIIAVYNLYELENDQYSLCVPYRKNQYVWSHTLDWTVIHNHNADFVTFLHQMNLSPWEAGLKFNKDHTPDNNPDLPENTEESVSAIMQSDSSTVELAPEDTLEEFCKVIASKKKGVIFGEVHTTRSRIFAIGPVKSNRFGN